MLIGLNDVNFNDLHKRLTYVSVWFDEEHGTEMGYVLVVWRNRENLQRTPYVCFYVGVNADEYVKFRADPVSENFSFLGIPNDTIDVSYDVSKVFLHDKPAAYVGIDVSTQFASAEAMEFELRQFVTAVMHIRSHYRCNPDQFYSSSKMLSESQRATKAFLPASAVRQE